MNKEILKARLAAYLDAERAILLSQSYQIGDRSLTRANLKEVQAEIRDLIAQLNSDDPSNGNRKRVVFIE